MSEEAFEAAQFNDDEDDDALVEQAEKSEEEAESEQEEKQHRKELAKKIFGDSDDEDEADGDSEDDQRLSSKKRSREEKDKKKRKKKDKEKSGKDKREKKGSKGDGKDSTNQTERMFAALGESKGFIDDEGLAEEDRDDRDSDADSVQAPEAVEEDSEFDRMFEYKSGGKRRKTTVCAAEARQHVELFLSKMELAVDQDQEANEKSMPAVHKLQMLKEVQEVVEKTYLHEDLLEAGLLNVMRAWLEPLKDGSIPNVNVRTTLLKLLKKLPVNVEMFDRRDQLKKSGLGKMVMFLYKLPEETMQNKKIAQALVEQWSRPIFELSTRYEDLRRAGEDDAHIPQSREKSRAAAGALGEADVVDGDKEEDGDTLRPGDPGYRWRASVPAASKMDYTMRPESKIKVDGPIKARNTAGNDGSRGFRIQKKMTSIALNARKKDVHAMKVSIEGRGLAL